MSVKNRIKHVLGRNPVVFYPVFKMFGEHRLKKECMLNEESELVIEGFPRMANTFSVVAFRYAQKRDVKMAHHLHVEAQILEGVKRKLPVIVLIRNPDDAVKSLIIREPDSSIKQMYQRYCEFYSAVSVVRDHVVFAKFEDVVSNFSDVINRLNAKFGTSYVPYYNNQSDDEAVYKIIDEINLELDGGKETHVARPSNDRKNLSLELEDSDVRNRAISLFNDLVVYA